MNPFRFLPNKWKERLRRRAGAVTIPDRLENLRRAGFRPRRIVDAGAHEGRWSAMISAIFPEAELLLIEPQPALTAPLERFCRTLPSARLRPVLLGREPGEARMLLEGTNSRIAPAGHPATGSPSAMVRVETLERVMRDANFLPCDLLKLDLQGHEIEALAGAGDLIERIEVIVIEVSLIRIGEVPLVDEVGKVLAGRGYLLYDIFGFNYRPRDRALWQADFVFVRHDSPLVASRSWA